MAIEGFEIIFSEDIPAPERRAAILRILGEDGISIEDVDAPIIQKGGGTSKRIAVSVVSLDKIIPIEKAVEDFPGVIIKGYAPKIHPTRENVLY